VNPFILLISPLPLLPPLAVAAAASAVELEVGVRHAGLLVGLADRRKRCLDCQEGNVEDRGRTAVVDLPGEVAAVFAHASFPFVAVGPVCTWVHLVLAFRTGPFALHPVLLVTILDASS